MKQSVLRAFALCLTTAFAAGYAYAEDDDKTKSSTSQIPGATTPGIGAPPGSSTAQYGSTSSQMGQPTRLSKLMNQSIRGQGGESVGQVQDIILDPSSGQVQFVVLSLSGSSATGAPGSSTSATSGIGTSTTDGTAGTGIGSTTSGLSSGSLVAVPWSLINQAGSDQYTVNADRTKLQSAPTFRSSSWPTMDSSWSQRVNSHFGVSATGAPGSGSSTSSGTLNPSSGIDSKTPTPGYPSTPRTTPGTTTPGTQSPSSGTGTGTPGSSGTGTSGSSGSGTSGSGAGGAGSGGQ